MLRWPPAPSETFAGVCKLLPVHPDFSGDIEASKNSRDFCLVPHRNICFWPLEGMSLVHKSGFPFLI